MALDPNAKVGVCIKVTAVHSEFILMFDMC